MMTRLWRLFSIMILIAIASCSTPPSPMPGLTPTPIPSATHISSPTQVPLAATQPATEPTQPQADPYALISQDSLFGFMQDLVSIQPYSGWRNSATEGEAEALDYVAGKLGEFKYLHSLGLEIERQPFRIFMATELWETRLALQVNGQAVDVPANGLRGHRDTIAQALRFDSDGAVNDRDRNPVTVEGPPVLIRSTQDIDALGSAGLRGKVAFVDYAVIDSSLLGKPRTGQIISSLLSKEPAGVVVVTRFSDQPRESHGTFIGDGSAFDLVESEWTPPTLYVRLEDLAPAGINTWDDWAKIETAHLTWDADVFSPAPSANLAARIPGADSSMAVILGAHIDSPNSPGAMDDGSGSVVLLEVARVLDAARVQPATDVYLVWFGCEEAGLYGSFHFVSTHQELLDRALAMLQIDMLSNPVNGIHPRLDLVTWPYGRFGDARLAWPDYLTQAAARRGVQTNPVDYYGLESDNTAFAAYDVPNANLIYKNDQEMAQVGPVHYAAHIHDPYDTVELAREVGDVLIQMAQVSLGAALETGRDAPNLRVAPAPDRRAVFVASHTEPVHMSPAAFTDLGMALAMEGLDVDLIPHGEAVTAADLKGAALVFVLPAADYPTLDSDITLYDEVWGQDEIAALEAYVAGGGVMVLTNSAYRLKYGNMVMDVNEDWSDVNALAERFGITYQDGTLAAGAPALIEASAPLVDGVTRLELAPGNGVPFSIAQGQVLARVEGELAVALIDHGKGQVVALADVGMLGAEWGEPPNLAFWQALARYSRSR